MAETDAISRWMDLLRRAVDRAERLAADLTPAEAAASPDPPRWSVNECLAHLTRTTTSYLDRMIPAIERARAKGWTGGEPYGDGPLVRGAIGRMILSAMRGGPAKLRVKAPRIFRPPPPETLVLDRVLADFRSATERLVGLLDESRGLPLGRIRFRTPVRMPFRVTAAQAFEILGLHDHRHLDQAEKAKADLRARVPPA